MAAKVEYGTSSKEVLAMQKFLNSQFGKFGVNIPEDGSYGDEMAAQVNALAGKIGYNADTKAIDGKFMAACKEALTPKAKIVVNGVEAWVTRDQLAKLQAAAGKKAGDAVAKYVSMAEEAKSLWDAHDKTRNNNWFWSTAIETATGAKFPPTSLISAAIAEAKALERDARACKATPADLSSRTGKIREAFAAMDQYREELFDGGEKLAKNLETIKDGCVITLQITAALATGGLSWEVQVGVSAGVAAYEQAMKEVVKASKEGNYDITTGVVNTFLAGVVDGTAGLILKGGKLGSFLDDVAKKAVEEAGSKWLKTFAIKAVNGGAQQMIKDGIKGLPGLADPKSKFTFEDFVKAAAKSFVIGAGLKNLGAVCEKYGKSAGKLFDAKDFEVFGKGADLDKAGTEAVKKAIEKIAPKIVEAKIDDWAIEKSEKELEQQIRDGILNDPAVIKAAQQAINDAKAGKKAKK